MAKVWTDKKLGTLKKKFGTIPNAKLAADLGVTERALLAKTKALRLKPHSPKKAPNRQHIRNENVGITGGEKTVTIDGEEVEMVPSGLVIKTEKGWEPVMIRKSRVSR